MESFIWNLTSFLSNADVINRYIINTKNSINGYITICDFVQRFCHFPYLVVYDIFLYFSHYSWLWFLVMGLVCLIWQLVINILPLIYFLAVDNIFLDIVPCEYVEKAYNIYIFLDIQSPIISIKFHCLQNLRCTKTIYESFDAHILF